MAGTALIFEFLLTEEDKKSGRNVAGEAVPVLKNRFDPRGLQDIDIRSLGKNRVQIDMPAASPETQQAKNAYHEALATLEEKNISRAEIRRVKSATGEQRKAEIDRLAAGNEQMAGNLAALAAAYDDRAKMQTELAHLRARLRVLRGDAGSSEESIKSLQEQIKKVGDQLKLKQQHEDDIEDTVKRGNVDPLLFGDILRNYVSQREKKYLDKTKSGKTELERRQVAFDEGLAKLQESHEARAEEIDRVAELYKAWDEERQEYEDPSDIQRVAARTGVLEFRIAPYNPVAGESKLDENEVMKYVELLREQGPDALRRANKPYLWFPLREGGEVSSALITADRAGKRYVLLHNTAGNMLLHEVGVNAWKLNNAYPTTDDLGMPAVGFEMDAIGADRMGKLTQKHQTYCMAILLDDEVYTAPRIQEGAIIRDKGIITGTPPDEVEDLVRTLRAGSLPGKLNPNPVSINSFGPAIGEEYKKMGITAAKWGLIAVAVFMLVYYLLSGFIADAALLLNVILVLGAMSMLNAVFTLPGIAGIILTIGIAVDANVLIFERLREEQAKSQSVRMAFKNAYERAFSAIFDANITTLIVCLILGWIGTEEVRGFAITLGLGVMFSLFTALVVTRWIFQTLLDTNIIKKPVFMMHIIGTPRVNWMSKRYFFWAISIAMMVGGIAAVVSQGRDIWGIEFSSGSQVTITLKDGELIDDKLPTDALVRQNYLVAAEGVEGTDKLVATARVTRRIDPERVKKFLRDHDTDKDGRITENEWTAQGLKKAYFVALAEEAGDKELTRKNLEGVLPANSYQITTTEVDVALIRKVARTAFGTSLAKRTACSSELVKGGKHKVLNIDISSDGVTEITPKKLGDIPSDYSELKDFEGGVLLVRKNISPAISQADMLGRIGDMRSQPDFEGKVYFTADVFGITPVGENAYSEFAVVFMPSEMSSLEGPGAWDDFAARVSDLTTAAMERAETGESRNFDATIAGETAGRAIMAVVLSWLAIVLYLWFRFGNWRWGLAAVICLVHDVIIVVGLVGMSAWLAKTAFGQAMAIDSFKIDLPMVAAILTVIGYSVNDTIVIFDRIRENRGKLTTVSSQVINLSVNQTLSRTLLTSSTTLAVVLIMYMFGGPGIHAFSYALLAGIMFGTYSSVAIASPLLMGFRKALVARTAGAVTE